MICWIPFDFPFSCKSSPSVSWSSSDFLFVYLFPNEGHRTLFIGVHVPLGGRKSHRRHRHRGHKHRKRDRERDSGAEDGRESPSFGKNLSCFDYILYCNIPIFTIPNLQQYFVKTIYVFIKHIGQAGKTWERKMLIFFLFSYISAFSWWK